MPLVNVVSVPEVETERSGFTEGHYYLFATPFAIYRCNIDTDAAPTGAVQDEWTRVSIPPDISIPQQSNGGQLTAGAVNINVDPSLFSSPLVIVSHDNGPSFNPATAGVLSWAYAVLPD